MKKLGQLFWVFFKIGAFTFGGGWAMVGLIQQEVVERMKWLTKEEFLDIIAIIQSFPGAIAINLASYIGRLMEGTKGSMIAVAGASLPSLIVIVLIAMFYTEFSHQTWWLKFVSGLLPVILALIIKSGVDIGKKTVKNKLDFSIFAISLLLIILGLHPLIVLFTGGVLGFFRQRYIAQQMKQKFKKNEV